MTWKKCKEQLFSFVLFGKANGKKSIGRSTKARVDQILMNLSHVDATQIFWENKKIIAEFNRL